MTEQLLDPGVMSALGALARAIAAVDHKVDKLEAKMDARFDAVDERLAVIETKMDARFDALMEEILNNR